ncbi:MAG: TetR family transcriptional regulator [Acetobacteraceae bacterium]|nr:TetR family transcriptional regulator [Acetobacteraceae bacterium]
MDTPADQDIDAALVAACFEQVAARGWLRLSIAEAARAAGIALVVARRRMPDRCALLLRFGALADARALQGAAPEGPARDRLFDLVMRRIDFLQAHRAGVVALLRAVPFDPPAALLLTAASLRSMAWLLEGAGIAAAGPQGGLRAAGMLAVWGWTVRAWQRDTSEDLAATMAALDAALTRAERAAGWLAPRPRVESPADSSTADSPHAGAADVPITPRE